MGQLIHMGTRAPTLLRHTTARLLLAVSLLISLAAAAPPPGNSPAVEPSAAGPSKLFIPLAVSHTPGSGIIGPDWPQLAHDAQRSGYTSEQVDPPYCYAWKWNAVPIASRVQPVVKNGLLYIGGLDGRLYARDATTGEPIWDYTTGGPIRHTAAASGQMVITGSYDGYTYALNAVTGALAWKTLTGSSATAPLVDESHQRVYVASTYGLLRALNLSNGSQVWQYDAKAAILTSPSLSEDNSLVFFGSESMDAIAVNANTGAQVWKTKLQGQSLAERFPVVAGSAVIYRSQPYYFFHNLLQGWGDDVMDQAGGVDANWTADWAKVKPKIVASLNANPSRQTYFVLNTSNGSNRGTAPVLYTYGSNDVPNVPIAAPNTTYLTYRARHGIQTDYPNIVHVTTKYDAELGKMDLNSLDITGLTASSSLTIPLTGGTSFRMTSDEAAMLTMGGNILWVDNWERLGGLNVSSGQIVHAGNVSNDWPECFAQCGAAGPHPFYPLSGKAGDPAYPFPGPRTSEGHARAGAVIANNMVFWRVADAGLAAFSHSTASNCPSPAVWTISGGALYVTNELPPEDPQPAAADLSVYVTTDRTIPVAVTSQNQDLVDRLNKEISALLTAANNNHLLPYYLERGFSNTQVWPYNSTKPEMPQIMYISFGNTYWHDPGEFLYSMALAYPYLSASLKTQLKTYVQAEMGRYPPLQDLPYNSTSKDWLHSGSPRELNPIVMRAELNNWPPVAANLSAIYAVWLWAKNTGDWSYADANYTQATSLFNSRKGSMNYYADIAGAIGYYRLAKHRNDFTAQTNALNAAVAAMNTGLNFATFRDRANTNYPDPRGYTTGWSAPVFYGMTPEVGQYLHEQFNTNAASYLLGLESLDSQGNGLVWWYFTRAGEHGENGETSFLTPLTAWSHFLAHAYVVGDHQANLRKWLDRPWTPGDLYSIQKIVATIQSPP